MASIKLTRLACETKTNGMLWWKRFVRCCFAGRELAHALLALQTRPFFVFVRHLVQKSRSMKAFVRELVRVRDDVANKDLPHSTLVLTSSLTGMLCHLETIARELTVVHSPAILLGSDRDRRQNRLEPKPRKTTNPLLAQALSGLRDFLVAASQTWEEFAEENRAIMTMLFGAMDVSYAWLIPSGAGQRRCCVQVDSYYSSTHDNFHAAYRTSVQLGVKVGYLCLHACMPNVTQHMVELTCALPCRTVL